MYMQVYTSLHTIIIYIYILYYLCVFKIYKVCVDVNVGNRKAPQNISFSLHPSCHSLLRICQIAWPLYIQMCRFQPCFREKPRTANPIYCTEI